MHSIPAEPCYVVSSGRLGSRFSRSRTVLWKGFAEFVVVAINPLFPPASMVKFLLQPYCSVLGKQHFCFFFLFPLFSQPSSCVVLAANSLCHRPCFPSLGMLLCGIASVLCQCLTPCNWQWIEEIIYRDPDSALSYACGNLWHYTIGLEKLKKSREIHSTESRSVNVRQDCCFCASTFYFKALPELQLMMLFRNIETEGQIWSVRCAVLSVEFAAKNVLTRCPGSVCAARQTCSVGFWLLAAFKLLATNILLHGLVSFGKEPGPSPSRGGHWRCSEAWGHLSGHWPCDLTSPRQQRTLSFLGQENWV